MGRTKLTILPALLTFALIAQRAHAFVIDSLTGDITANEIAQYNTSINGMTPATNNYGDEMADHQTGCTCEGMARMYEATGNVQVLNSLIKWCDVLLSHRNDLPLGEHRVMWDGKIEPVWPPETPTSTFPGYAGSESAQVGGHIAACAYLILRTPSLWYATVPDSDPNHYGITYKQRALKYIALLDACKNNYDTRWFVSKLDHKLRWPANSQWGVGSGGDTQGAAVPWNQQMMFVKAYQYLAMCHDILGDNPSFLSTYKAVVKTFAHEFVASAANYTSNGHNVCKWYYSGSSNIENIGHAQHDVQGLFNAYISNYSDVTLPQITCFADTSAYIINLGATDSWSGNVDGTGTITTSLKTDFIVLAEFNRSLYPLIAQSNIDAGLINSGTERAKNTAFILYMKHWIFTH